MKFSWGRKSEAKRQKEAERQREQEAAGWCTLIRTGRIGEYLKWLEQRPREEIINRFFGIINTKDSWLPILFQEETPPEVIDGIRVDSIQNRIGRRLTKITLLLMVKDESQKLGIWNQLSPQWIEEYKQQIKAEVRIMEATAKQCADTGQESKAVDIRKKIEDLKETNKEYAIDW